MGIGHVGLPSLEFGEVGPECTSHCSSGDFTCDVLGIHHMIYRYNTGAYNLVVCACVRVCVMVVGEGTVDRFINTNR